MASPWKATQLPNGIHAFSGGETEPGTPIVLLSGWPETILSFTEIFPLLSTTHPTLALDLPGLGQSAPSQTGYDTSTIAALLSSAVHSLPAYKTQPYHLVGHDVGAWIAWTWAASFPEHVKSVTLIDANVPGLAPPLSYPLPAAANIKLWQFSFNSLPELPEILTKGRERELLDWLFDQKAVHPERLTEERRKEYARAYAKEGGMSNGFAYYRAVGRSAELNLALLKKGKGKLETPILTVGGRGGAGDVLYKSMVPLAKDVRGTVIEDCGHYILEEQPEVLAEALLEFWKGVDGSA